MLKVHLCDGKTLNFDLGDVDQAKTWFRNLRDQSFQSRITALTVAHRGVQYSVPRPKGFDSVSFFAENVPVVPESKIKGGERVVCLAGEVRAVVMVHREQRAARLSLFRLGKQRFNPGYGPAPEGG
jgi:hypothetical protein